MPATTVPAATRTVFGTWTPCAVTDDLDIEAQVVFGTYEPEISAGAPPPAALQATPCAHTDINTLRGTTCASRAAYYDGMLYVPHRDDLPPPYAEDVEPPAYTDVAEPPTLAMYLFKLGFLFPLFWLAGSCILLCPLTPPEGWESIKTEPERENLVDLLRRTEVKWAQRCLISLSTLVLVVLFAMFAGVAMRCS